MDSKTLSMPLSHFKSLKLWVHKTLFQNCVIEIRHRIFFCILSGTCSNKDVALWSAFNTCDSWTRTPYFYLHSYTKKLQATFTNIILLTGLFQNFHNSRTLIVFCSIFALLRQAFCSYFPNAFPFPLPVKVNPIYEYHRPDHRQISLAFGVSYFWQRLISRYFIKFNDDWIKLKFLNRKGNFVKCVWVNTTPPPTKIR